MEDKLIKAFQKAKYEPRAELSSEIWHYVAMRNKRTNLIKSGVFAVVGLFSLAGLAPAINMTLQSLAKSGIYEYFSLLFESGSGALSYWREILLSVAESLPVMSLVLTLSLVFIFFLSIRFMMQQLEKSQAIKLAAL